MVYIGQFCGGKKTAHGKRDYPKNGLDSIYSSNWLGILSRHSPHKKSVLNGVSGNISMYIVGKCNLYGKSNTFAYVKSHAFSFGLRHLLCAK